MSETPKAAIEKLHNVLVKNNFTAKLSDESSFILVEVPNNDEWKSFVELVSRVSGEDLDPDVGEYEFSCYGATFCGGLDGFIAHIDIVDQ